MNPHSKPIIDNFDDEWDVESLVPQTPPAKIMLSKERMKIFHERISAGHGTHHVHWIVYDDYKPEIHGNNIPDSHMILVTGDPRQNGGVLSFDGVDVEWNMIIEKRDVFLEGAGGDREEAWDMFHRFRAHKERQAHKERVYQAMLAELGGNEPLAREVHALWCKQEEQPEDPEDGHQEMGDENEQDMLARATIWAKGFKKGYELRDLSLPKSPAKTTSSVEQEDGDQSNEPEQELDIYDCLDDWAMRFDEQQKEEGDHSLGEDTTKTATTNMCEGTDRLIDIEHDLSIYDRLGEWAMSFERDTRHASVSDKTSKFVDNKDTSKLIDIETKTPDVYECLDLLAQQFGDLSDGNSSTKERLPEAVKATLTGTTDCTDILYDGKAATETTMATTPILQRHDGY
ncbi:hypothetical protein QBC45DRAFT_338206 [Copromyces sp. CBS 386.78]|nr:hypothetical protein QBC45DRAFT_338206 [Copromyces sp. CBS 386.78]